MSHHSAKDTESLPAPDQQGVLFILSVDTEEEFDWDGAYPRENCSVKNVTKIPKFQAFCESHSIRPTYLVDYPVANDRDSALILSKIAESKKAEIGAHLHPWCTPPFHGETGEYESHVINLPPKLVAQKLNRLTHAIEENIKVVPTSFRTGRWGTDEAVLSAVKNAGYNIDSSVYPYYANNYFSCHGSPNIPYWPSIKKPLVPGFQKDIFEIPITAGFSRPNFPFWSKLHNAMSARPFSLLRLVGLAWKTKIFRKLYLSPELSSPSDMISLINASLHSGNPVVHMFIHSSTLLPGQNEFTKNSADEKEFYHDISTVIEHLTSTTSVTFCTLSEAKILLQNGFAGYTPPQNNRDK